MMRQFPCGEFEHTYSQIIGIAIDQVARLYTRRRILTDDNGVINPFNQRNKTEEVLINLSVWQ